MTDGRGQPAAGLTREDFVLREEGDLQELTLFAEAAFPLAVGVAIDRSFSMAGLKLATAKSAARQFLGALREADESMVVAIGSETQVVAPLSRDRAVQLASIDKLDSFGTTALHDAIGAAIEAVQPGRGRRALVLLSDGADRYSATTAADVLARARRADLLIYPIALGPERPTMFAELAALTGGRSYHVRKREQLADTLGAVAAELRQQYLLGYTPARPPRAGTNEWRSIEVTVRRPGLTVRARDGYLVK